MGIVQKLAICLMDTPGSVCKLDTVAQNPGHDPGTVQTCVSIETQLVATLLGVVDHPSDFRRTSI